MADIRTEILIVGYGSPVDDAMHMTEHVLPSRLFVFKLRDTRNAANQDWLSTAKVIKIRAANKSTRPNV